MLHEIIGSISININEVMLTAKSAYYYYYYYYYYHHHHHQQQQQQKHSVMPNIKVVSKSLEPNAKLGGVMFQTNCHIVY
jgi:hypothetical protein